MTLSESVSRYLLGINSLPIIAVMMFGLAINFAWAIIAYWFIYFLRETNNPLQTSMTVSGTVLIPIIFLYVFTIRSHK